MSAIDRVDIDGGDDGWVDDLDEFASEQRTETLTDRIRGLVGV